MQVSLSLSAAVVSRRVSVALPALLLALGACSKPAEEHPSARPAAAPTPTTTAESNGAVGISPDSALRTAADQGRILGSPNAKVWMIMVSDFQCPYCKRWHDDTFATLRREYVESGKVRMAYVNFPLRQHQHAMPAAEYAMCAGAQKKFWEFQDGVFGTQAKWENLPDASPVFDSIGTAIGANVPQLRQCVASHVMRPLIEADQARSERAGVQSTPTFIMGDQRIEGAYPADSFRVKLDAALAAAGAAPSR
jgi:protein-disulfide isomerase